MVVCCNCCVSDGVNGWIRANLQSELDKTLHKCSLYSPFTLVLQWCLNGRNEQMHEVERDWKLQSACLQSRQSVECLMVIYYCFRTQPPWNYQQIVFYHSITFSLNLSVTQTLCHFVALYTQVGKLTTKPFQHTVSWSVHHWYLSRIRLSCNSSRSQCGY